MTYYVHTIADTITGEITRFVIAEADVTLGLDISETVSQRRGLVDFVGGGLPVQVITRREPMDRRIRIKIEGWREEQGGAAERLDGDGLAACFFREREERP